ncbi:hypothetical protein KUCAC02_002268, partial [Chaenocephalus aceratus]
AFVIVRWLRGLGVSACICWLLSAGQPLSVTCEGLLFESCWNSEAHIPPEPWTYLSPTQTTEEGQLLADTQ